MPETPKSVFREIAARRHQAWLHSENPKTVFRRVAERQRQLLQRQQEYEVLALCARAEQQADFDQRFAVYRLISRYDLGHMAPELRDRVWQLLHGMVVADAERQFEAAPVAVNP